jgi:hypothetical protein
MACQWNENMYPINQGSGMKEGMYPGAAQPMQMPSCPQITNIRTRRASGQSAGMVAPPVAADGMPLMPPVSADTPSTVQSPYYTAGFLRNFIGCNMRVEFLIGTSGALVDRIGVLMEVGASYIVLQPFQTDDLLMCDLYSIKFVTIYA